MVNFPRIGNAYAEYVVAPGNRLAKTPKNISFKKSTATTLTALTALQVLEQAKKHNVNVSFLMVQSNKNDMNTLKNLLEKGTFKPHASGTFAFEDMAKEHLQLESGRTVGKVVVEL